MILINRITEYDIRKCNISVLYQDGYINKELYDRLYKSDSSIRQIEIGCMLRDTPDLYNKLKESTDKYVDMFISENNIEDGSVLERVNDAIWINTIPTKTKFGDYVEFINKRTSSSTFFINKRTSIHYDSLTGKLFQRGFGNIDLDAFSIFEIIKTTLKYAERDVHLSIKYLLENIKKYRDKDLSKSHYKELPINKNTINIHPSQTFYVSKEVVMCEDANLKILFLLLNDLSSL